WPFGRVVSEPVVVVVFFAHAALLSSFASVDDSASSRRVPPSATSASNSAESAANCPTAQRRRQSGVMGSLPRRAGLARLRRAVAAAPLAASFKATALVVLSLLRVLVATTVTLKLQLPLAGRVRPQGSRSRWTVAR